MVRGQGVGVVSGRRSALVTSADQRAGDGDATATPRPRMPGESRAGARATRPTGGAGTSADVDTDVVPLGRPVGLLEKLIAVVRPQFRAEVLVFDPRDPVFGGPPCTVPGCERPLRENGMCTAHTQRWRATGYPDLTEFIATTRPDFFGQRPLQGCIVAGCRFGTQGRGLCHRHYNQWRSHGQPPLPDWATSVAPRAAPDPAPPVCAVLSCQLWANPRSAWCFLHRRRWIESGRGLTPLHSLSVNIGQPPEAIGPRACRAPPAGLGVGSGCGARSGRVPRSRLEDIQRLCRCHGHDGAAGLGEDAKLWDARKCAAANSDSYRVATWWSYLMWLRKQSRISWASRSGTSIAAKWPPRSNSDQCLMS
jgi:hypothetical protein